MTEPDDSPRLTPLPTAIAGAPISWGVCEVPGLGLPATTRTTVLAQMREVGLAATEFGPDGFLPDDPADKAATLADHGLRAVGRFVPVVLHDPGARPAARGRRRRWRAGRRRRLARVVLAAATGQEGYDDRPVLDERGWSTLLGNLDRIADAAAARGLTGDAAPARRHDGRERRGDRPGARGQPHRPVPRHRAPAHRRRRPGRASPRAHRRGSGTRTSRTSTRTGPRRCRPAR